MVETEAGVAAVEEDVVDGEAGEAGGGGGPIRRQRGGGAGRSAPYSRVSVILLIMKRLSYSKSWFCKDIGLKSFMEMHDPCYKKISKIVFHTVYSGDLFNFYL